MSEQYDGGSAFPSQAMGMQGGATEGLNYGISSRDYFAAAALQGLLACQSLGYEYTATERFEIAAKEAYKFADSMLDEKEDFQ